MTMTCLLPRCGIFILLSCLLMGCTSETASHPLDESLARASVVKAMQAWKDGKTPEDLKPEIIVGDSAWEKGKKLTSFEIVPAEESSDGSNLHIVVKQLLGDRESSVTYIVGTSPTITIFPQ